MTGRPGVAFVTRGPGATNASSGVHVAFQDSTPMILFVGDVARGDRDREGFQEIDFPAFFGPIAKWAARIDDAAADPEYVARAFRVGDRGRPGPVVLALPEDMLRDEVEAADRPCVPPLAEAPDPGAVDRPVRAAQGGRRPGRDRRRRRLEPARGASFRQLRLSAMAFPSPPPSVARTRSQHLRASMRAISATGPTRCSQQRIRDADLILAVGPRLGEATTDGYTLITPDHPGQTWSTSTPTRTSSAGSITPICRSAPTWASSPRWSTSGAIPNWSGSGRAKRPTRMAGLVGRPSLGKASSSTSARASRRCARSSRPNTIICNGAGNFSGWWHRYWRYGPMPTQLAPTSGTMGYGLPAAVAAAIRFRDRPVVCVAGDGDFLMNGQELATAAQYAADLLIILVDNGSYGTIRMHQEREYPARSAPPNWSIPTSPRSPAPMAAGPRRSRRRRNSPPRSTRP